MHIAHTHTHTHTHTYRITMFSCNNSCHVSITTGVSLASGLVSWYRYWSTAQNYLVSCRNHDYWLLSQHYFAQVISLCQLWTLTRTNRVLEVANIFTKHSKCCDKFFVLTMSLYALGPTSLLYKQLLQYTLLKSFTVPSALLSTFPKKFHMKLLASAFIFTKLSTKTLLLWRRRVSFEYQGYCKTSPHRSYCFLSMFKLHCKRHYSNLAPHSWCTTWCEHITKTAPEQRRHAVVGGAQL